MNVDNLSSYQLTNEDLQLLSKGLSFTPTPNIPSHIFHTYIRQQYNEFARTVQLQFARTSASAIATCDKHIHYSPPYPTSHTYRPMKFLPKHTYTSPTSEYCTNARVEYLRDMNVYRPVHSFPDTELTQLITNQLVAFRHTLHSHSKSLHLFLQPTHKHSTIH